MLTAGVVLRRCVPRSAFLRSLLPFRVVQTRCYSTPPIPNASNEEVQVQVKIGLDRHVKLAIRQPPRPDNNAPIILYLHRGLVDKSLPSPSINELAFGANAVTVRLDYRVSKEEPYPFPIHSVLAGYDWIQQHLLPPRYTRSHERISERNPPQIGVCGELIGGSLATMLALTECHGEKRGAIRAAAVGNPVVDWTALEEPEEESLGGTTLRKSVKSKKQKPSPASSHVADPSRDALLSLRAQYFRKPEKYFDAFASPLLFFRTPRYAVPDGPHTHPGEDSLGGWASSADEYVPDEEPEPELVKKRLSHRNYPPLGSDLVLPRMRLDLGDQSVVKDQALEMAELWRRSQTKRKESQPFGSDNSFDTLIREGHGLWGEREMLELGRWFGEALRKT